MELNVEQSGKTIECSLLCLWGQGTMFLGVLCGKLKADKEHAYSKVISRTANTNVLDSGSYVDIMSFFFLCPSPFNKAAALITAVV